MNRAFEYDVFISYCPKDKEAVHTLAKNLKQDGLRVWLDVWAIQPGDSTSQKIQQGLEKSRTLLICMSPSYFTSEWSTIEPQSLIFRDHTNAGRRFIPLLIENCMIPGSIIQFAYIDWQIPSKLVYNRLLTACRETEAAAGRKFRVDKAKMVLKGHIIYVRCVAVTSDGKTVISGSNDNTIKVWDIASGNCKKTLEGHTDTIFCVAVTADGKTVISGSSDRTIKVWDIASGNCKKTLEGHTDTIFFVSSTSDDKTVISGSNDNTIKIWDLSSGHCKKTLEGHTDTIFCVAVTADGKTVISGSSDRTIKVWDIASGHCKKTLEGHTDMIYCVTVTSDGKTVISGSSDRTIKVWDMETGKCRATFEGYTDTVYCVAVTSDGKTVISGSSDRTIKVWDMETGKCRATFEGHFSTVYCLAVTSDGKTVISGSSDFTLMVWDIPQQDSIIDVVNSTCYTNAKVAVIGRTGVGKTGLSMRLCYGSWEPTESTHGMNIYPLELPQEANVLNKERDVWLWDFAGQPDYKLIHQLFMDETSLGMIVFDPQEDMPFEDIGYWNNALQSAAKYKPVKLLIAARCDRGGITISRSQFEQYIKENDFADFFFTGAKTGDGCKELKEAIARYIPWERLPWTSTSLLFKKLKEEILKLIEKDVPLIRLSELLQRLQLIFPEEAIGESELRAVVGLMQSQGLVQMLNFGDYLLLQTEWINRYASIIVRVAREHVDEMGTVGERMVLEGDFDYKDMKRISNVDEKILLRAIVQTFMDRSLCLREETPSGTMLVFPSYFNRNKSNLSNHPHIFVTYEFSGPLDEIYSTLVVRLSYSNWFKKDQLWKDAADFKTPGGKRVGLAMRKKLDGKADIVVYFEADVPDDTKVMFIKYIHEHLLARAQPPEGVTRIRSYICPHCNEPLENPRAIHIRLTKGLKDISCSVCDTRVQLYDLIEEKFGSKEFLQQVKELDKQAGINLDNQSRELILVGHTIAIAAEAGQVYRPVIWADWGIDGEIEFKDHKGNASGKRVYLQLKSGDSYIYERKHDDVEVFTVKNKRQAEYWLAQAYPVMLVIRTSDGRIRWMNITEYLKHHGADTRQIVFDGEPYTAVNIAQMRDRILKT